MPQVSCPVLVGRDAELAALTRLTDAPRGGCGLVLGEAGIGKPRLVRDFAQRARAAGLLVLSGRSVQGAEQR